MLKQQESIFFLQVWKLGVPDQGAVGLVSSEIAPAGLQMAVSHCVLPWPFLFVGILLVSLPHLLKTPVLLDEGLI